MEDNDHETLGLLTYTHFRQYNIHIARKLTTNASILLVEFCGKYGYHKSRGELVQNDGEYWFYYSVDTAYQRLGLSREEQDTALRYLDKFKLINRKVFGCPPRRYFSLNINHIRNLMAKLIENDFQDDEMDTKTKVKNSRKSISGKNTNSNVENTHSYSISNETNLMKLTHSKSGGVDTNSNSRKNPFPCPPFLAFGSHVKLMPDAYDKLCAAHTKSYIDSLIEEMNDYCSCKLPEGYLCYASALRQWLRRRSEGTARSQGYISKTTGAKMAQHRPGAIVQGETPEQRIAMGGKRVNPSLYRLLESQGRDMRGYISDETIT